MKATLAIIAATLAMASTSPAANGPSQPSEPLEGQVVVRPDNRRLPAPELKPNQIVAGKLTYEGIVVEMVKVDNLLQLINPAAPARYGSPEDNVVRNPLNNRVTGLKIFSIKF